MWYISSTRSKLTKCDAGSSGYTWYLDMFRDNLSARMGPAGGGSEV